MIRFPVLRSLTIKNYLLYPRSSDAPFHIPFQPGPNLIVGVNGSGKSTLISAALRALTGPYDLPSATSEGELGQVRHKPIPLSRYDRQSFARRVADGATNATASLEVGFGSDVIKIERNLANLNLISVTDNGNPVNLQTRREDLPEDSAYQAFINSKIGVGSFFDTLIIIRYMLFLMEDRRALVWDPTAQRQIFRVLLLPEEKAAEYAEAQEDLISADSALRNAQSLITRQQREKSKASQRATTVDQAEAEKRVKSAQVSALRDRLEALAKARLEADTDRKSARLDRLKATDERESLLRELEHIKLQTLSHWLTPSKETARYILGQLLSEDLCLVCGTQPSPMKKTIEDRIRSGACPVCGAIHKTEDKVVHLAEADSIRIQKLENDIRLSEKQINDAQKRLFEAQERLISTDLVYEEVEREMHEINLEIINLLKKIPSDRAAIISADSEIDALQRIVDNERRRRTDAERRLEKLIAEATMKVTAIQNEISNCFTHYTSLFIKEEANLVYQAVEGRVGQGGAKFIFPTFRLAMSSGAIAGTTIREQPDQVSQSQAEFVDLAFRMALMSVISADGSGSLVIDAPEASLDFLFAARAGAQLSAFSFATPTNRVIATSYLPSKHFVSSFLDRISDPSERKARIVDLINLAAENAALRADKPQYEEFLHQVIECR